VRLDDLEPREQRLQIGSDHLFQPHEAQGGAADLGEGNITTSGGGDPTRGPVPVT
jgi:hypothetical protein